MKNITKALQMLADLNTEEAGGAALAALAEVRDLEKAARALVDWNVQGRPAFHLDAARGYDMLERIARESST